MPGALKIAAAAIVAAALLFVWHVVVADWLVDRLRVALGG